MISLNKFLDCFGYSGYNDRDAFENESNTSYITYDHNNKHDEYEKYIGKRVKIKSSRKPVYIKNKIIDMYGTVKKVSSNSIGVDIDGKYNSASGYGIYWFNKNELEIIENESEDYVMNFEYVAIVNLLDDINKKDYAFGLYKEDYSANEVWYEHTLAVVNPINKDSRKLGIIKEVMPVETYLSIDKNRGKKITAEVIGVVNMKPYFAREEEKVRLAELAKKKAAIEKELEAEINKRKSVEYYEEMAKKYSDNPKLAELVAELKNLGA